MLITGAKAPCHAVDIKKSNPVPFWLNLAGGLFIPVYKLSVCVYMYVYVCMCICVCVCTCVREVLGCECVCLQCVCWCVCVFACVYMQVKICNICKRLRVPY